MKLNFKMSVREAEENISFEWKVAFSEWNKEPRQCFKCNAIYYESNNMGKWQCVQKHVARNPRTREQYEFLVRADHCNVLNMNYSNLDDIKIDKIVFERLKNSYFSNVFGIIGRTDPAIGRRDGFSLNFNYVIRRYDWITQHTIGKLVPDIPDSFVETAYYKLTKYPNVSLIVPRNLLRK